MTGWPLIKMTSTPYYNRIVNLILYQNHCWRFPYYILQEKTTFLIATWSDVKEATPIAFGTKPFSCTCLHACQLKYPYCATANKFCSGHVLRSSSGCNQRGQPGNSPRYF